MRISQKGWIHDDIGQHIQDNFGERWTDRFLRLGIFDSKVLRVRWSPRFGVH